MHLLSEYGENTGYTKEEAEISLTRIHNLNAGLEHAYGGKRIKKSKWIKNPQWIKVVELNKVIEKYDVDTVYIPLRDLEATAKSREYQEKHTHGKYGGFFMGANNTQDQQVINAVLFYHLIQYLSEKGIRYRLISFERMTHDPRYLFHRLELEDYDKFLDSYNKIIDLNKIRF